MKARGGSSFGLISNYVFGCGSKARLLLDDVHLVHDSQVTYQSILPPLDPSYVLCTSNDFPSLMRVSNIQRTPRGLHTTFVQSMLASSSSSTKPHIVMLSPRTRYKPCGTSELDSGSSRGRIILSVVLFRTMFVSWSQDRRSPTSVRPSAVITKTFSCGHDR